MLVIAAVRDMTDREKAIKERDQLIRLSAVVEFSGEAIISSTLDGIITSWNPAAERLYGYSSEEIIGKSGSLLIPPDRTGELKAILAKVRAGQTVENFETTRVRKDGTVFPVSLTVSPIRDADGAIIGASAIARDVTPEEGIRGRPAHVGGGRVQRGSHHQQHARRHHHELEPGRREAVRLLQPGDRRQVHPAPESPRIDPTRSRPS